MITIILLTIFLTGLSFEQRTVSVYSTTDPKFVAIVADSSLEKEPEIGHFEHLCSEYGGF